MGFIQALGLPQNLKALIEKHLTEGRVGSEEDYLAEALRRYAGDLEAEDELAAITDEGIADMEASFKRCSWLVQYSAAFLPAVMNDIKLTRGDDIPSCPAAGLSAPVSF